MTAVVGLFFGSDTGNTEKVANKIRDTLGADLVDIYDVAKATQEDLLKYDFLIFGCPTWYTGELQADWENFVPTLRQVSLNDKIVALFGCGDQEDYSEYSFYSPATDNASWVEEALARIEEERIAEELRAMEESLSDYEEDDLEYEEENQSSEEELNEETSQEEGLEDSEAAEADTESEEKREEEISEVEKFFQEEKKGQIKTEKNDYLKFFEFDDETFSQQRVNGKLILIHSSRNSVTRNFYNENYLLEKRESWNIGSAENASLQKTERFEYYKDSSLISSKKITEKDFTERVSYNAQGQAGKI